MAGEADFVKQIFRETYPGAAEPRVFRAPGRVNLIGEHTDYNQGFVLPIAIDLACYAAVAPASNASLTVRSQNLGETESWAVESIQSLQPRDHWTDYVIGIAQQLQRLGFELEPANIVLYSTVPVGSGLSSSAAIEVSSALAFLSGRAIDKKELAKLAQRAEREFAGVPCGIMDQYVSVFGEEHHAIQIDCRTIEHRAAPLPSGAAIVVVNSMVKHDLGTSAYATRVEECAEAVRLIQRTYPTVTSLRDVSLQALDLLGPDLPANVLRRACHVVSENERVVSFAAAASEADLLSMGRLFLSSHRSLQKDYEVSCEELDFLVDTAADFSGVYGSRMTGGGFGGCTVNLVAPDRVDAFKTYGSEAYRKHYGLEPQVYGFVPASGAGEI